MVFVKSRLFYSFNDYTVLVHLWSIITVTASAFQGLSLFTTVSVTVTVTVFPKTTPVISVTLSSFSWGTIRYNTCNIKKVVRC